jgi:hypothetical protein
MSGMEADEKSFWVWLSILTILLGTAPFAYWQGYHWTGILCGVASIGGLLMLIRDRLAETASKWPIRLSLRVLAIVSLSLVVGQLIAREMAGNRGMERTPLQWWLYGLALVLIAVVVSASLAKKKQSKLVIHSANYRAWKGGGETFDVADSIRSLISGDSLVLDRIENHSFWADGKNLAPRDPLDGQAKRLEVSYSFGGDKPRTIQRTEHGRLVLPEDSAIEWLEKQMQQLKAVQPKPPQHPVPQLRMKIVEMVSELQGFLGAHGEEPRDRKLGESAEDWKRRNDAEVAPWRARFIGEYRQQFGNRISDLQDEIRARAHLNDAELDAHIRGAAVNPNICCFALTKITETLWELGLKVNV